mmetsp:Transcript_20406/g.46335  ORF Transcript_20406/g.46335 Transcript_20406/m.46335 type:complete len:500 (-) Transcript_20406:215-1714(-)
MSTSGHRNSSGGNLERKKVRFADNTLDIEEGGVDSALTHASFTDSGGSVTKKRKFPVRRIRSPLSSPEKSGNQHKDTGGESSGDESDSESEGDESDEEETKKKMIDLEMLLDLCVIRLKLPDTNERNDEPLLLFSAASAMKKMIPKTRFGKRLSKAVGKKFKSAGSAASKIRRGTAKMAKKSVSLVTERVPLLQGRVDPNNEETSKNPVCCSRYIALLCAPCTAMFKEKWSKIEVRVWFCPYVLIFFWTLIRIALASFLRFLRPLLGLFLPYVALVMSLITIVTQCWVISLPLAGSIASLLSQLQDLIDYAFSQMLDMIPKTLIKLLTTLKVPEFLAANLCKVLFMPLKEALGTVQKLIPRVDKILPTWVKEPKPLVPVIFVGLLVALFFGQLLLLLQMGTMVGSGDVEVLLCIFFCVILGKVGVYSRKIVTLLLSIIELVLNGIIQFLLRKVLVVEKLQKGIDMTVNALPRPSFKKKRKKKRKQKKNEVKKQNLSEKN